MGWLLPADASGSGLDCSDTTAAGAVRDRQAESSARVLGLRRLMVT